MKKLILLFLSLQIQAGSFSKGINWASKIIRHSVPFLVTADTLYSLSVLDDAYSVLERIPEPDYGQKIDLGEGDYKLIGLKIPLLIRQEAEKKLGKDRASRLNLISERKRSSMSACIDNKSRDYLFISPRELVVLSVNEDQRKVNKARAVLQHEFTHLKEHHCGNSIFEYEFFHFNMYCLGLYGISLFVRPAKSCFVTIGMRCISPVLLVLSSALVVCPLKNTLLNCREHEWQADEGIENDPGVLQGAIDYFKESQQGWNRLSLLTKIRLSIKDANCHPSDEARIARFEERLALLKQKSSEPIV